MSEFASVRTRTEAEAVVCDLLERQIAAAVRDKPPPNTATVGDAEVREAFWLLLDGRQKATVFKRFVRRRDFWPRVRTCVGAPPFSFLDAADIDLLNAGGVARGRINMGTSGAGVTPANEIARGAHFVDASKRAYTIVASDAKADPSTVFLQAKPGRRLVLDTKMAFKGSKRREQNQLLPAKIGERLQLIQNRKLGDGNVTALVKTIQLDRTVARLFVEIV
jgi:hypothetical protein